MAFFDDASDTLGSGLSGGLTGFGIAGPIGGAVGAGVGILSSLLGPKRKKKQQYQDPYQAQRNALINDLSASNLGQQQAAIAEKHTGNLARDQMEQIANNPNFAGNASVLSGLNSDLLRNAEAGAAQARIAGAAQDQSARIQAGSLMGQGSQMAQNQYQFDAMNPEKPSFGESALQNILSYGSGLGLSKLTNPQATTTTDVQTKTLANRPNIDSGSFQTPIQDAGGFDPMDGLLDQEAPESPSYTPGMLENERMGGFGGASLNYDGGSSFDWLQTQGMAGPFDGQRSVSDIVYGRY